MRPRRSNKAQLPFSSRGCTRLQRGTKSAILSFAFCAFLRAQACKRNEAKRLFTYRTGDHPHRAFDHDPRRIAARESFGETSKGATAPRDVARDAHGNRRVSSRHDGHGLSGSCRSDSRTTSSAAAR